MRRKDYTRMTFIAVVVVLIAAGCAVKTEPFPVGTYLCSAELDNAFMEDGTFKITGGGVVNLSRIKSHGEARTASDPISTSRKQVCGRFYL